MNNLDELQQLMDEQQEIHERLLAGPEYAYRQTCPQCLGTFYTTHPICSCPICLVRSMDAYEKSREGPQHPIMKSYTSLDRPIYVLGKGLTFYVKDVWEATSPIRGEVVIIDDKEYRVNWVSGFRSDAAKELYLEIGTTTPPPKPIPAPQKQDLPQGDTKTAAEEIDALKRRIEAIESYLWGTRESV